MRIPHIADQVNKTLRFKIQHISKEIHYKRDIDCKQNLRREDSSSFA